MRNVYATVRQPVITEKATLGQQLPDGTKVYCFRVDLRANKIEIAQAVEKLFGVKVAQVRTSRVPARIRRMGRTVGHKPAWKKAWVKLVAGEKEIPLFEAN